MYSNQVSKFSASQDYQFNLTQNSVSQVSSNIQQKRFSTGKMAPKVPLEQTKQKTKKARVPAAAPMPSSSPIKVPSKQHNQFAKISDEI